MEGPWLAMWASTSTSSDSPMTCPYGGDAVTSAISASSTFRRLLIALGSTPGFTLIVIGATRSISNVMVSALLSKSGSRSSSSVSHTTARPLCARPVRPPRKAQADDGITVTPTNAEDDTAALKLGDPETRRHQTPTSNKKMTSSAPGPSTPSLRPVRRSDSLAVTT